MARGTRSLDNPNFGYEPTPEQAESQMKDFAKALNRVKVGARGRIRLEHVAKELVFRELVMKWQESGPNLRQLFKRYPDLERRTRSGRTTFSPAHTGAVI